MNLPDGKARTQRRVFSRETSIQADIDAGPELIWKVLTDASRYPTWNSTVLSLEGKIELGEKIALRSTLAPTRTFRHRIKEWEVNRRMAWGDAMGTRVYELEKLSPNQTRVTIREKIGGPLFPLFAAMIPDFDESFERFIVDLRKATLKDSDSQSIA